MTRLRTRFRLNLCGGSRDRLQRDNRRDSEFHPPADLNADHKIDNCDSDILAANWLLPGGRTENHYYYHYDGLGSVIAISDESGNTIEKYEYSVYGDVQTLPKGLRKTWVLMCALLTSRNRISSKML